MFVNQLKKKQSKHSLQLPQSTNFEIMGFLANFIISGNNFKIGELREDLH